MKRWLFLICVLTLCSSPAQAQIATGTGTSQTIGAGSIVGTVAPANGGTGSSSVPSAGQIPVGNAGGTAYAPKSLSQDCTNDSNGVVTCTKAGNGAGSYQAGSLGVGTAADGHAGDVKATGVISTAPNVITLADGATTFAVDFSKSNFQQVVYPASAVGGATITSVTVTANPPNPGTVVYFYFLNSNTTQTFTVNAAAWPNPPFKPNNTGYSSFLVGIYGVSPTRAQVKQFLWDGTSYSGMHSDQPIFNQITSYAYVGSGGNIANQAGNITTTTGKNGSTSGGHSTHSGGTAPTLTAGCNGAGSAVLANANCTAGSTPFACCTGAGTGTCQQSNDVRGKFLTQAAAATTCTLTFNVAFDSAPICHYWDASSSITPLAESEGAETTTTAIVDFASVSAKLIGYACDE